MDSKALESDPAQPVGEYVRERLFQLRDEKYLAFTAKLIPTLDPGLIIGVRAPQLRALAAELAKMPGAAEEYMRLLPHRYYEENNVHAALIDRIKDVDGCIAVIDAFLPFVDNWATCDCMSPKLFKKRPPRLLEKIPQWLASGRTYTVRFGIEMLMGFYLDEGFETKYLDWVSAIRSDEYYINMMTAWYFATALAKQYDAALPYLKDRRLDVWTHNKTIRKAIESYRITDAQKDYLRTLKA